MDIDRLGRIAIVGSVNMDLVVHTPRVPKLGETIIGSDFMTAPGGKGANQACAAARLGGEVRMLARVGADAFGEQLREHLSASGVIVEDVVSIAESPSGIAMIVVHQGDNFIVIDPGANHCLTPDDVRDFGTHIADSDIVLVQLEVPLDVVAEVVRVAGEAGTPVLLNPAPAAELSRETLAGVSYLTPNEGEAALLAGIEGELSDAESVDSAIRSLSALGVGTVCVTLGGDGVAYSDAGAPVRRRPAPPVEPVDTTAAGDVFSGALAVALTEGRSMEDAVTFAQTASGISVTRPGAGPSIPSRDEVDERLSS